MRRIETGARDASGTSAESRREPETPRARAQNRDGGGRRASREVSGTGAESGRTRERGSGRASVLLIGVLAATLLAAAPARAQNGDIEVERTVRSVGIHGNESVGEGTLKKLLRTRGRGGSNQGSLF